MDRKVTDLFFALLRGAALGEKGCSDEQKDAILSCSESLFDLSSRHDLAHLVGASLFEEGMTDVYAAFERSHLLAVFRHESIVYEQERVCQLLEAAEIPHMPLKGALLRDLYPEPWMRASCDVDVLIHAEDLDSAVAFLSQNGYTVGEKTSHDVGLSSGGQIPVELHFRLWENGQGDGICTVLDEVLSHAVPAEGYRYRLLMPDEYFYFYHVAHMAKHVEHGGCGVRPFLDLWFLDRNQENEPQRNALLERGALLTFAEAARRLCGVWFGNASHDGVTEALADYILFGGVYGNEENRVALQQQQQGGRFRYAMSRIFIPFPVLKVYFPILNKHPWLAPIMQVCRWFRIFRRGDAKRSVRELQYNQNLDGKTAEQMKHLLDNLGLPGA